MKVGLVFGKNKCDILCNNIIMPINLQTTTKEGEACSHEFLNVVIQLL